mmetsp:Transcript_1588/g.5081  ORF Transcript_1588/g.5081 Transcript_1588/m.5081 type:complete len:230 (-) Transcript_1588:122-811(-)
MTTGTLRLYGSYCVCAFLPLRVFFFASAFEMSVRAEKLVMCCRDTPCDGAGRLGASSTSSPSRVWMMLTSPSGCASKEIRLWEKLRRNGSRAAKAPLRVSISALTKLMPDMVLLSLPPSPTRPAGATIMLGRGEDCATGDEDEEAAVLFRSSHLHLTFMMVPGVISRDRLPRKLSQVAGVERSSFMMTNLNSTALPAGTRMAAEDQSGKLSDVVVIGKASVRIHSPRTS